MVTRRTREYTRLTVREMSVRVETHFECWGTHREALPDIGYVGRVSISTEEQPSE